MTATLPFVRVLAAVSVTGTLALAAAACASGTGAKSSSAAQPAAGGGAAAAPGAANNGAADKAGAPGQPAPPQPTGRGPEQAPVGNAADQRSIIYTGTITLRVSNVDEAAAKITGAAEGAGGFVGGDHRGKDGSSATATLTLRVPSARFSAIVNDIAQHYGHEESRELSTEDVTAKAVDLAARIAAAQASVDRVRALMARAQNLSDVVSIESELSRREGDLESLQGQKRMLDDQTALSTITVVLLSPQATVPSKPTRPQKGFLAGLKAGWRAFTGSLSVLLTVVGALLPWLLLVGVPAAAVLVYLRRRRALPPAAEPAAQLAAEVPPAAG